MSQDNFTEWAKGFTAEMNDALSRFSPRNSPTGDNSDWRRYYVIDNKGREKFVCHLRPAPTKGRMNVMVGLPESKLKIPKDGPSLEHRDKSAKNYREFDVDFDDDRTKEVALDLAVQVATYHTGLL